MKQQPILLIGAGLAGCLLAIYLGRRGFSIKLFEQRTDMRRHDIAAGRSINLSLSERGIHALKEVGLFHKVEKYLVAMPGRMLHNQNGQCRYQPYGKNAGDVHYSVSRGALNKLLLDGAESTGRVSLFFNENCTGLDFKTNRLSFRNKKSGSRHSIDFNTVIGSDGAGSAVGHALAEEKAIEMRHEHLPHGYKELAIPADRNGGYQLEKNALHIWPRGGYMLIALPNIDGSFTATLFLPLTGPDSFESLVDKQSVCDFFGTQFPDTRELIPDLASEFFCHPTGNLGTIRSAPWRLAGKVLLIGDAAHAIVPFHGQGMNAAFEDCASLNQHLDRIDDWETLFDAFESERKPNADAIADMALENYIEMRDAVRDPKFHLRKNIEWFLEARHTDRFIPRYSMVMFHRFPYAVVQQRGEIQAAILARLSESIEHLENLDIPLADRLVKERLNRIKSIGCG